MVLTWQNEQNFTLDESSQKSAKSCQKTGGNLKASELEKCQNRNCEQDCAQHRCGKKVAELKLVRGRKRRSRIRCQMPDAVGRGGESRIKCQTPWDEGEEQNQTTACDYCVSLSPDVRLANSRGFCPRSILPEIPKASASTAGCRTPQSPRRTFFGCFWAGEILNLNVECHWKWKLKMSNLPPS